jgi:hypothetical protein
VLEGAVEGDGHIAVAAFLSIKAVFVAPQKSTGSAPLLAFQKVDEGAQRSGHLAAAMVAEEGTGEGRQPIPQDRLEGAAIEVGPDKAFECADDAESGDRLAEALGALTVKLDAADRAAIEKAVPNGSAAGERYDSWGMATLDSEK